MSTRQDGWYTNLKRDRCYGFHNILLPFLITHFYQSPNGQTTRKSTLHSSLSNHLVTGGDSPPHCYLPQHHHLQPQSLTHPHPCWSVHVLLLFRQNSKNQLQFHTFKGFLFTIEGVQLVLKCRKNSETFC